MKKIILVLKYITVLMSVSFIIIFIYIALQRVNYPYDLEWSEDSSLEIISRIRAGLDIYTRPSVDYIPAMYTPLYFYVSALFSNIGGLNFFSLRFISIIAIIASMVLIYKIVHDESKDKYLSIISTGLFAATFRISGAWFDLAKVDSLMLFFLLLCIYFIRFSQFKYNHIIAGIIFTLCFYTKQSVFTVIPFIFLYYLFFQRKYLLHFFITFLGLSTSFFLIYNFLTNGWFYYYIYEIPKSLNIASAMYINFWIYDIFSKFCIISSVVTLWLIYYFVKKSNWKTVEHVLLFGGLIFLSWAGRLSPGGYDNVLIPAYAALSILFSIGVANLKLKKNKSIILSAIFILLIIQFSKLNYNIEAQIPSDRDKRAGDSLVQYIKNTKGRILIPTDAYLNIFAGKKSNFRLIGLWELLGYFGNKEKEDGKVLKKTISEKIKKQEFFAIILNYSILTFPISNKPWFPFYADMNKFYKEEKIFFDENTFNHVTGFKTKTNYLYIPRKPAN